MPIFTRSDISAPIFYSHVPKTGGTYIEDLFIKNGYKRHLWNSRPKRTGFVVSPQHFHAEIYMKIVNFGLVKWSFMTVRNPLDRLLSEFRAHPIPGKRKFKDWLSYISSEYSKDNYIRDNHLRPQAEFMRDGIEFIKTDAHLSEDWAKSISLEHGLDFKYFSVDKKRNTTSKKNFALDDEDLDMAIEFCQKIYKKDFEAFGYKIEDANAVSGRDRR
ncbi:sulfotransferase family 2 domain-containing protein [Paracoccus alkanivorans]|uniref:Sulfotransferase family protein n=1 Tax=Paracoccus alkanivorans TaxID=2116655 RepID=A0A3M0MIR2_9RHOB|nr:sulfotransferase family 2 domain-containing protein [Paracoccus alkanivorans]RMC37479.1 hypothetical protein C9E81_01640 [Paracoccus alkanivorans]